MAFLKNERTITNRVNDVIIISIDGASPKIVNKTIKNDIDILLISTLMLPSALKVKDVVKVLRDRDSSVKIIVGGAPFRLDSNLWKKVNADFDGKNGSEVLKIIKSMREENNYELNGACNDNN